MWNERLSQRDKIEENAARNHSTRATDAAALSNDKAKIAATHQEKGSSVLTVDAVDTGKPLFRVETNYRPKIIDVGAKIHLAFTPRTTPSSLSPVLPSAPILPASLSTM